MTAGKLLGQLQLVARTVLSRATATTTPVDGDETSEDECTNNLLTGGIKFTNLRDFKAFMKNESSEDESSDTSSDKEEIGCGIDLHQMLAIYWKGPSARIERRFANRLARGR